MGWFLRSQTTGGSKRSGGRGGAGKASKTKDPLAARWDPQRTLMGLKVLGALALIGSLGAAWHFSQQALTDYARTHHAAPVTAEDVVLENAPNWMPAGLELETRRLVAAEVGDDPVDNTTLRAAAGALDAWAWIAPNGVRQVTRLADGRIAVDVAFRSPLAVIRARDGYHLVSHEGVRLPALYGREQIDRMNVPVLIGATAAPPRKGERWPGEDVAAGLALVRFLAGEPFMDEVRSIDISGQDGRGRLRLALRTEQGAVLWGLPPGEEQSVEPDSETKLHRLRQVVATRGSIDAGGRIVHLYGATVQVSRSTLETPGGQSGGQRDHHFGAFQ